MKSLKEKAGQLNAENASPAVQSAFNLMRNIVTFGWAIYPLGYLMGYMMGNGFIALNII